MQAVLASQLKVYRVPGVPLTGAKFGMPPITPSAPTGAVAKRISICPSSSRKLREIAYREVRLRYDRQKDKLTALQGAASGARVRKRLVVPHLPAA